MPSEPLPPTTFVIFGITGDLSHRYLLPALYYLAENDLLPVQCKIVGVSRRDVSVDEVLAGIQSSIEAVNLECRPDILKALAEKIEIVTMSLVESADYARLRQRLDAIEDKANVCMSRLYYLAIPSQTYEQVVERLGENGLNEGCKHGNDNARLLIEKPFGYDLASAEELITKLNEHFTEEQIYRIDHYLAKETAQNILAFRFGNPIFKRVWDNKSITGITVSAAESIGIEGRVVFYEQTGALRDFVQSHLLQLLSLVAMEEPDELDEDEIHKQKQALLDAIKPIAPDAVMREAVRGQYEGYKEEVKNPDSFVETYAALRLSIDNDRWRGVPIVVETGKDLKERRTEIVLSFSDASKLSQDNVLHIQIQPQEGVLLRLLAKKPGFDDRLTPVDMDFDYNRSFAGNNGHPDAYERVLVDAFRGDKTLFATREEILASWRIIDNVAHEWGKNGNGLEIYQRGTWGPDVVENLRQDMGDIGRS